MSLALRQTAKLWAMLTLAMICATAQSASFEPRFQQQRSWAFMQNVGGIALEQAFNEAGHWFLPVSCNVSGIKAVTTTPRTLHSKLAWWQTKASVEDGRIYLTIVTALQGLRAPTSICGPAKLEAVHAGDYDVFYRDLDGSLHGMGKVTIGAC
ncbi:MAG: hypothetical protein ACR2PS_18840 [Pseudomonadales bacterium]